MCEHVLLGCSKCSARVAELEAVISAGADLQAIQALQKEVRETRRRIAESEELRAALVREAVNHAQTMEQAMAQILKYSRISELVGDLRDSDGAISPDALLKLFEAYDAMERPS